MAEQQTAELIAQEWRGPPGGRERPCKGHHPIVFRTRLGQLKLNSPPAVPLPMRVPGAKKFQPPEDKIKQPA